MYKNIASLTTGILSGKTLITMEFRATRPDRPPANMHGTVSILPRFFRAFSRKFASFNHPQFVQFYGARIGRAGIFGVLSFYGVLPGWRTPRYLYSGICIKILFRQLPEFQAQKY